MDANKSPGNGRPLPILKKSLFILVSLVMRGSCHFSRPIDEGMRRGGFWNADARKKLDRLSIVGNVSAFGMTAVVLFLLGSRVFTSLIASVIAPLHVRTKSGKTRYLRSFIYRSPRQCAIGIPSLFSPLESHNPGRSTVVRSTLDGLITSILSTSSVRPRSEASIPNHSLVCSINEGRSSRWQVGLNSRSLWHSCSSSRYRPGSIGALIDEVWPHRKATSTVNGVQGVQLMGKGMWVIASRTELFPVDLMPQTISKGVFGV